MNEQRPIKFRAWDKTINEWSNAFDMDNEGVVYPAASPHKGEIVIMQYTGLKDKNGREIWEGDLVERHNFIGELQGRYEVRWGQFGFTLWDKNHPEVTSYYVSPDQLEVIGNVHETPQLS